MALSIILCKCKTAGNMTCSFLFKYNFDKSFIMDIPKELLSKDFVSQFKNACQLPFFFGTVGRTIQTHYLRIVAFFKNRATNAASESFNTKIKQFRALLRGVRDVSFFLFRLSKIYA